MDVIKPFQNKPWILRVCSTSLFENTVGKGEIAHNKQFILFPQCFLPFWKTFYHFHQTRNCCLQTLSAWKSLKFVIWKRVNPCFARTWLTSCLQAKDTKVVPLAAGLFKNQNSCCATY